LIIEAAAAATVAIVVQSEYVNSWNHFIFSNFASMFAGIAGFFSGLASDSTNQLISKEDINTFNNTWWTHTGHDVGIIIVVLLGTYLIHLLDVPGRIKSAIQFVASEFTFDDSEDEEEEEP
jgi:hypothetical protein